MLVMVLVAATISAGCAANSYRIPTKDLHQLSAMPPEQRGQRVRVIQEISATDAPAARPVEADTEIVIMPRLHFSTGLHLGSRGRFGGRFGGVSKVGKVGGAASDGKAAAVALLVIAAFALVAVAGVQGSRFDGWARLHPMHPVHLFGRDGSYLVMPLAAIDADTAMWAEKAVVRPTEGPWMSLDRAPLTRGWTYGMYGGSGSLRSVNGEKELGPAFTIQAGYFPDQHVGILANIFFGWRDNVVNETLFESRYTLEVQALPIRAGKLHAGLYAGAGYAYRYEDGTKLRNTNEPGSTALTGGAMLQLELHTRIALTARFGLAKAHGERMSDILVGLSVY
jgi:hypothetical protein